MAGATLSNKDAILQVAYEDGVWNAMNTFSALWSKLPEKTGLTGRQTQMSIRHGRPQGFAFGPSPISIPGPSTSKHSEGKVWPSYWYQTIGLDWDIIEQSRANSYNPAVTEELEAAAESAIMSMDRQCLGDGSGRLGTVVDVSSSAGSAFVFTVTGADNLVFFEEGMRMEFLLGTGTYREATKYTNPAQGYYEIASVAVSGSTITVTCTADSVHPASGAPVTGAYAIVYGSVVLDVTGGGYNAGNELVGIKALIDNTDSPLLVNTDSANFPSDVTTQGISGTNNYWWQSKVVDGTGQYLNLDLATQVGDEISNHGGGMGADDLQMIVSHSFQIRKYIGTLYPQERFPNPGNTGKFTSGADTMFNRAEGPMMGNLPTIKSRYCDKSIAYLIGPGLMRYVMKPYGFYNGDGSMWARDPSGRPRAIATAYAYLQLAIKKRNCSGKITGLTTS